ncbi:MAG: hypothetical protein ACTH7Q_08005 [Pseudoalteromonas sp.]
MREKTVNIKKHALFNDTRCLINEQLNIKTSHQVVATEQTKQLLWLIEKAASSLKS